MPFKCFNYGKVGDFQNKCPYPKMDYEDERSRDRTFKKREKTFYKKNPYKGKNNFYSKEEEHSSNESNDSDQEKALFLGIAEENEHEEELESEEEVNTKQNFSVPWMSWKDTETSIDNLRILWLSKRKKTRIGREGDWYFDQWTKKPNHGGKGKGRMPGISS